MEVHQLIVGQILQTAPAKNGLIDQHLHSVPLAKMPDHLDVRLARHRIHPAQPVNRRIASWRRGRDALSKFRQ